MPTKQDEKVEFPFTAPPDIRYPNCGNAGRYCFQMFVDYHRCTRLLGADHAPCDYFRKTYQSLCPLFWVEKWEKQIEEGTFALDLPEKPPEDPKKKKK